GSEKRGVEASSKDLFSDAMCFLTDGNAVGEPWAGLLERFWESLGCRVCWTDAATHDELVARISHFPHLIAAAAAKVSLRDPSDARFGGGGLRDTTRVAGGDPDMWAEILMENRTAVSSSVSDAIAMLKEIQGALEAGNHEAIKSWLESAHDLHRMSQSSMKPSGKIS
ncbi:prephenate dehydrogenase, partial [Haloferula sp.]|uniref:prephenate dehydrogenase n=1 Tax=Haloferula sp. TaxID=2497595 RepID=UPI003C791D69